MMGILSIKKRHGHRLLIPPPPPPPPHLSFFSTKIMVGLALCKILLMEIIAIPCCVDICIIFQSW